MRSLHCVLYTTFHFPEHLVNVVTSSECDEDTLCPEYKEVAVERVEARGGDGRDRAPVKGGKVKGKRSREKTPSHHPPGIRGHSRHIRYQSR